MSTTEKITEVLTKHGWPPATLVVVLLLAGALFVLYQDHRDVQQKWQDLARGNLEANLIATSQRADLQKALNSSLKIQDGHLKTIKEMEQARLRQNQLDQQLTSAAIQALRQIADKVDVQLQMDRPKELLNSTPPRR